MYSISNPTKKLKGSIQLTASKSESNRALIIQALSKDKFPIENLASAQDTQTLQEILTADQAHLQSDKNKETRTYDVGPAGTTMRFLTAYFATTPGTRILTGSERMKQRPIGILVDALRKLGAKITYLEEEGYPPLQIEGKTLKGGELEIVGNISSQFISALLLVSPALQNGLVIHFKGEITSRPYINMTLKMMEEFEVVGTWHDNSISVSKQKYQWNGDSDYAYMVEGDWSAASYWYAFASLADEVDFTIKGLKSASMQGDSIVSELFNFFNVTTTYGDDGIHLKKVNIKNEHFGFDFSDCPDIAQTIAVVSGLLNIPSYFNGLHTLRIKETDRVYALREELAKIGVDIEIIDDCSMQVTTPGLHAPKAPIKTYDDHRMAMAFAAIAMKYDNVLIAHPEVVRKSYPDFWKDLRKSGFVVKEA
ncbi:MAG TPA: 3-phosphoshikimate 1-carboxyvinyltransferase [Bacteroidia bacterium]|nr:3-phosphoshikimate 1-carboxyvinyltransferase [Bacteroidia bacterium]